MTLKEQIQEIKVRMENSQIKIIDDDWVPRTSKLIFKDIPWAIEKLEVALKIIEFYADEADWEYGFQEGGQKAREFLKGVGECEHHWTRRRDGRQCSKCDEIQFGVGE